MTELDAMASRCPAALTCTVETLGVSYEGKDIKVLRVSKNNHFMTLKFEEKSHNIILWVKNRYIK